ncbi:MAG: 30S ribosomal protein THX [Bacteroidales bacterium]
MGKGDKKTKRGKIINGSYGARRPKKHAKPIVEESAPKSKKK